MNWHKKAQSSSKEKWIFGILEQMLKATDNQDIKTILSLNNILKSYFSSLEEITASEPIKSFLSKTKNRLLSQADNAHKNIGQILVMLSEYENLKRII